MYALILLTFIFWEITHVEALLFCFSLATASIPRFLKYRMPARPPHAVLPPLWFVHRYRKNKLMGRTACGSGNGYSTIPNGLLLPGLLWPGRSKAVSFQHTGCWKGKFGTLTIKEQQHSEVITMFSFICFKLIPLCRDTQIRALWLIRH